MYRFRNVIFERLSVVSLTFSHWTEIFPGESISMIIFKKQKKNGIANDAARFLQFYY